MASTKHPNEAPLLTADGKWRLRIAFLSSANDRGSHQTLQHIHARTAPESRGAVQLGAFSAWSASSVEVWPSGLEVGGRGVQLELVAPPSAFVLMSERDACMVSAEALVLVPSAQADLDLMLGRLEVIRNPMPPTAIQLSRGLWSPDDITAVDAGASQLVCTADLESGNGTLDALKALVFQLVRDLRLACQVPS